MLQRQENLGENDENDVRSSPDYVASTKKTLAMAAQASKLEPEILEKLGVPAYVPDAVIAKIEAEAAAPADETPVQKMERLYAESAARGKPLGRDILKRETGLGPTVIANWLKKQRAQVSAHELKPARSEGGRPDEPLSANTVAKLTNTSRATAQRNLKRAKQTIEQAVQAANAVLKVPESEEPIDEETFNGPDLEVQFTGKTYRVPAQPHSDSWRRHEQGREGELPIRLCEGESGTSGRQAVGSRYALKRNEYWHRYR